MDETPGQPQWDVREEAATPLGEERAPQLPPIQWSAAEFISHQKTAAWFIVLGAAAAVATLIVVVISGSIISGIIVALTCIVLGFYAARKPETKHYEINEQGIIAGDHAYMYESFKSFSLVEDGAASSIWLRPLRRYTPTIVMYFAREDEEKIVAMLENFLPEENRALDAIDRFARRIRF